MKILAGFAYGLAAGMALKGLLDYGDALAGKANRPLDGKAVEAALNRHRRLTGRKPL